MAIVSTEVVVRLSLKRPPCERDFVQCDRGPCGCGPRAGAPLRLLRRRSPNALLCEAARVRRAVFFMVSDSGSPPARRGSHAAQVVIPGTVVSDLVPARIGMHTAHHAKLAAMVVDASPARREKRNIRKRTTRRTRGRRKLRLDNPWTTPWTTPRQPPGQPPPVFPAYGLGPSSGSRCYFAPSRSYPC